MIVGRSSLCRAMRCRCISLVVVDDECTSAVDIKYGAVSGKKTERRRTTALFSFAKEAPDYNQMLVLLRITQWYSTGGSYLSVAEQMLKNAPRNRRQPHQQGNTYWHVRSWRLFSFFPLEKWIKQLIYYQNGCQIISWPSIINWVIAAALVKILAGAALCSCPVPPTEPLPLYVTRLRILM